MCKAKLENSLGPDDMLISFLGPGCWPWDGSICNQICGGLEIGLQSQFAQI